MPSICSIHQTPELGCDLCATDFDELRERAVAVTDHVKNQLLGDDMQCPSCGMSVPIRRDQEHSTWDVECGCGWAAVGSGPPRIENRN